MKVYNVVDMFCGAGGESTGIMRAAEAKGLKINLFAINHWERAMETHAANHPRANHICESVERVDPSKVIRNGIVDLLWASPECVHFSNARGGRPRSDQSRASAWLILKWLSDLYVERVIIENVPEFLTWGELDRSGRPIKERRGETFNAFTRALSGIGYSVDWRILTAADYGDPTTRKRLFVQAVKGGKKILWPEATHGEKSGRAPWVPAKEIIDWSVQGTSIFDRKRPLADATVNRIAIGIKKYWKEYATPFLAMLYGTGTVKSVDEPLSSVTCMGSHHALVEPVPMLLGQQSCAAARPVDRPAPTVATAGAISLIQPLVMEYYGNGGTGPVTKPLKTVTAKDRFALVEPGEKGVRLDIRFRMLKNHELKRAQGFPENYDIRGNTAEQTKQIGNAVPVNLAEALAHAALP